MNDQDAELSRQFRNHDQRLTAVAVLLRLMLDEVPEPSRTKLWRRVTAACRAETVKRQPTLKAMLAYFCQALDPKGRKLAREMDILHRAKHPDERKRKGRKA